MREFITSGPLEDTALNGADAIEFEGFVTFGDLQNGRRVKHVFQPDATKGYFVFNMATAFPYGVSLYGTGMHADIVAGGYASLLNQQMNYEHQLAAYHKKPNKPNHVDDQILGSVVAVNFPQSAQGGWKFPKGEQDGGKTSPPLITAVASYAKLHKKMPGIVGEHQTGRHKWSVSMEAQYDLEKSGFALKLAGDPKFNFTPKDMLEAGWEYVPFDKAPEKLQKTFSRPKQRIVSTFSNRETVLLMGGLTGSVHFAGVGLVRYGAEGTAGISRMVARQNPVEELVNTLESFAEEVGKLKVT